jgi:hypothetical protein
MRTPRALWSRLRKPRVWRRLLVERFTEPLHLNVLAVFVLLFGSYRARVNWDLIMRPHYAFGILRAADVARELGVRRVTLVEFGVASGGGLMNMAAIARHVAEITGVQFVIHGFDTGTGMPPARDYRDHPDLYQQGDFGMDSEALQRILPDNVHLHLGPLHVTVPQFVERLGTAAPLGFVALDVDYYSSTVDALAAFRGDPRSYLPLVVVYADDVNLDQHNSACGEFLAIAEFNASMPLRPIEQNAFLEHSRIFRRPSWIKQTYFAHILDHPTRTEVQSTTTKRYMENPYLRSQQARERFVLPPPGRPAP